FALESSLYISNRHKVTDQLTLEYGLRYNNFTQLGPGTVYTFDGEGEVSNSQEYGEWESVVSYHGLAPRFTGTYVLNEQQSIKGGYARTYQYLHLLSNSTGGTPVDLWLPSSNNIAPEVADQISLGYFRNFDDNRYEFSVEAYYKNLQRVIDYKPGATITLNPEVEGELLFGDGRAYGIEFYLKKKAGRFTGWLSYTLARSQRQFDEINGGAWFSATQDRIHDISLVAMYQWTERISLSAAWVYWTGNAVTFPTGQYTIDGQVYNYYGERNANRMPDYHRLDVGLNIDGKKYKQDRNPVTGELVTVPKRFQSSWNFSCYNLYGRENAYTISFQPSSVDPTQSEAVRLALFKWVPSVTWNFEF
ncbi:MAG: TonB-dependent receptor, partial [Bacteroidota bacterium]